MVGASDAVQIYERLTTNGVPVWIVGGWGVDALLGEQTRPPKDLDILIRVDDVRTTLDLLEQDGFRDKERWPENVLVHDSQGHEIATAFVLVDEAGREVDIHAMRIDDRGYGLPAWDWDGLLEPEDLAGTGSINGVPVRCFSATVQLAHHSNYDLPATHLSDVEHLRRRLGLDPDGP